jgi:hypothetical protein
MTRCSCYTDEAIASRFGLALQEPSTLLEHQHTIKLLQCSSFALHRSAVHSQETPNSIRRLPCSRYFTVRLISIKSWQGNPTMAPILQDLPNELVERIVLHVDLPDICNLRSSSRVLAFKASQKHFKSFFQKKHVYLNKPSLVTFVRATEVSKLCCSVQHLVPVGRMIDAAPHFEPNVVVRPGHDRSQPGQQSDTVKITNKTRNSVHGLRKSQKNVGMLGKALRNLSLGGTTPRCLPRLYLEADYRCRDTRQDLSGEGKSHRLSLDRDDLAARSFHFTVEALVLSGLKTQRLNIYYGEASDEPCAYAKNGLYSDELLGIEARYPGLRTCLASTMSLSIGLCPPRSRRCPDDESGIGSSLSLQEAKPGLNV